MRNVVASFLERIRKDNRCLPGSRQNAVFTPAGFSHDAISFLPNGWASPFETHNVIVLSAVWYSELKKTCSNAPRGQELVT
jgi:hypothetical protein